MVAPQPICAGTPSPTLVHSKHAQPTLNLLLHVAQSMMPVEPLLQVASISTVVQYLTRLVLTIHT